MVNYFIKFATEFSEQIIIGIDANNIIWSIPMDVENYDYVAYLAWVEAGNTATEWQPEANAE